MIRPFVQVEKLTIGYQNAAGELVDVLQAVSFNLERGEKLGLAGESGSGKSTLALALLGFLRSGSQQKGGTIHVNEVNIFRAGTAALQQMRGKVVALVPQNAGQSLTPTMTVGSQIAEVIRAHPLASSDGVQSQVSNLLRQVQLPDPEQLARRYPYQLSGGQQQRVAIAMALACKPELLILDEPTTGLDVTTQVSILDLLEELHRQGGFAMVYVSHDLAVVARICDRVMILYAGEVVETGKTHDVFERPVHPYTQRLLDAVPRLQSPIVPRGIPGQPPVPGLHPRGCAFAPRCSLADTMCQSQKPDLEIVASTSQQVRCFHWKTAQIESQVPSSLFAEPLALNGDKLPVLEIVELESSYAAQGLHRAWRRLRRVAEPPSTLRNINLRIWPSETLALVGESGSGKSTLARVMAGLHPPRSGQIRFRQEELPDDVGQRAMHTRRAIQLIFQNPDASLNPRQTVNQILEKPLRLYFGLGRAERRTRAVELLEQVRLGSHCLGRYPAQLSGGEKQRVAIARAFAAEPDLVLCDEVVSALDVSVQATILNLLTRLKIERRVAYLFIAHDLAVVRSIADRVAVLYAGELCEVGTTEQVFAPPYHPYTQRLMAAAAGTKIDSGRQVLPGAHASGRPGARGCVFQTSCPRHLGAICDEVTPPWQAGDNGHRIRCHDATLMQPAIQC